METLLKEIQLPEGIEAFLEGTMLKIKGPKGEIEKDFSYPTVFLEKKENTIILKTEFPKRKEKAVFGTYEAHIKNMFTGVTQGFCYKLKVLYSHFPITIKVEETEVLIQNLFGEKSPRRAKIVGNVKINVQKEIVCVEGINKEDVAQTAANFERSTRVKRRDTRVFQDGVYVVEKNEGADETAPAQEAPNEEKAEKPEEKEEVKEDEKESESPKESV